MTVKVTKPAINVREELADLRKPTGIAGEAMLRAETPQEQFNLIGAGRRNLIINGGMQHWQRSTSASVSSSNGNSYLACDRWMTIFDVANSATATISQSTDVPSGQGFKYSQLHTVTAADTVTLSAFRYILEGYDHANILGNWVTVSFWFKASVAGNYSYNHHVISNGGFMKQFNYPTANVWQKVEMTYYVPEDAIYNTSSGIGSRLYVVLGASGVVSSTAEYPSWNGSAATKYGLSSNQVALNTISGASAQITGVQLELGKVATPFEHRSYGEELALCQRYYEQLNGTGASGNYAGFATGFSHGLYGPVLVTMRTTKRINPTFTYGGSLRLLSASGTTTFNIGLDSYLDKSGTGYINLNSFGTSTGTGYAIMVTANNDANAYFAFDAEL